MKICCYAQLYSALQIKSQGHNVTWQFGEYSPWRLAPKFGGHHPEYCHDGGRVGDRTHRDGCSLCVNRDGSYPGRVPSRAAAEVVTVPGPVSVACLIALLATLFLIGMKVAFRNGSHRRRLLFSRRPRIRRPLATRTTAAMVKPSLGIPEPEKGGLRTL